MRTPLPRFASFWSFLGHASASFQSLSGRRGRYLPAVAFLPALLALIPVRTEAAYTATQVTILPPGSTRVVRGANDAGEIVGGARLAEGHRGFVVNSGPPQSIEGMPSSDYSFALGINNLGETVGSANTATGLRAFRARRTTGAVELVPLRGDSSSAAANINQSGQVVGYSSGPAGVRAVIWSRTNAVQALPIPTGSISSRGLGINDQGDAVGVANTGSGLRAVVWKSGGVSVLDSLPGHGESEAVGINNTGQVIGSSGDPTIQRRAALWSANGTVQSLGTLPGGNSSRALAINNRGEVVGRSESRNGNRAVLWTQKDGMRDLNDLITLRTGFVLTEAVSISPRGVIVAVGQDEATPAGAHGHDHEDHELPLRVFRLVPVP